MRTAPRLTIRKIPVAHIVFFIALHVRRDGKGLLQVEQPGVERKKTEFDGPTRGCKREELDPHKLMHKQEIQKNYLAQVDKSVNSERVVADRNQKG
jgi:hypothetical protein